MDDGPIISGINAAWHGLHPHTGDLVAAATDDDVLQLWLTDRSQPAADFVRHYLLTHRATGNDVTSAPTTVRASGLQAVYAGAGSARYFGVPISDPRHPEIFGVVRHGVVYTGGTSKIAEHGGAGVQDRAVPIVVSGPGVRHGAVDRTRVETTRIAPTILRLLGVNPRELAAVRAEHTLALPVSAGQRTHRPRRDCPDRRRRPVSRSRVALLASMALVLGGLGAAGPAAATSAPSGAAATRCRTMTTSSSSSRRTTDSTT